MGEGLGTAVGCLGRPLVYSLGFLLLRAKHQKGIDVFGVAEAENVDWLDAAALDGRLAIAF